jgi:hypothetical protein
MQRQNRVPFENALAKAMLEEIPNNSKIKSVLTEIATTLHSHVFTRAVDIISKSEQSKDMEAPMKEVMHAWATQHSKGDMFLGALLPDHSLEELKHTTPGRSLLLRAMEKALSVENIERLNTLHDVITLIKTLDGMGYYYLSDAYPKSSPDEYEKIKSMIFPTAEECDMRCLRDEKVLAITYGIGTEFNKDLMPQEKQTEGSLSGKARFFIPSAEKRFEKLADRFDQADRSEDEKAKQALAHKLSYYGIPLNKDDRDLAETYAKHHTPWFQKLAREKDSLEPLPLIASASQSTSRSLITLLHLGAFHKIDATFDLEKAQLYANCLMGYYVFCGHHSFLEVMEIWNRLLDYVAIYHPEQLPAGIFPDEQSLPYGRIGDYRYFLHVDYADRLLKTAQANIKNQETWLPLAQHLHMLGHSIFKRTSQPEGELTDDNTSEYSAGQGIKKGVQI